MENTLAVEDSTALAETALSALAETALTVIKSHPELIAVNGRALSSHGWRYDLFAEHLHAHSNLGDKWCSVSCAARTFFGRNTPTHRAGVRRRLGRAFQEMLLRGRFVVIDYATGPGHRGEARAFKILNPTSEMERSYAEVQLARMMKRHELSAEREERARALLGGV